MPIFDQGYQHWAGQLSGHAWRWLAITRHGVRVGLKGKMLRIVLIVSWLPALALAFMLCIWGLLEQHSKFVATFLPFLSFLHPEILIDPRHYRVEIWTICFNFFLLIELRFAMILILLVGPNLISQDLRFNALPLYLSRPLRRIDYFLGKLGVIAAFLARIIIVPSIIAYVLGLLFSKDITILRDTFPILLSSIAYGLIIALSAGLLILALSSLSRNSRYIALFWVGIWFVSSIASTILQGVEHDQRRHAFYNKPEVRRSTHSNSMPFLREEQRKAQRAQQLAYQKAWDDFQNEELQAVKTDWRPLVSYTANISRVGERLLGTDACWHTISKLQPPEQRGRFLMQMTSMHPWHWSAAVLAGLFGISAWILKSQIKSLDRLK